MNQLSTLSHISFFLFSEELCIKIALIHQTGSLLFICNFLGASPTKWSNTLKQFVGNSRQSCQSLFSHFVCVVLEISRFLCVCKICKFQNLLRHQRHSESYTFVYFFWILSAIKMKFSQILMYLIIFLTCFWLSAGDWKLVPAPFMILMKWQ